jgi:hypothetical protein
MNSAQSRLHAQPRFITTRVIATLALTAALGLSACGLSPEAMKKDRTEKLEKFASTVVEHILDKNPETLKMSITTFMRDEVNDSERDKLQTAKIIPDSPIDVERMMQENQAAGRSNVVSITSVKALTPIEKDSVKFEVVGNEVTKLKGKVTDTKPFRYELTVLLNSEMSGYPRLTDMSGVVAPAATADSSQAASTKGGKKLKQRRRG